jgi:hypothetical protein
MGWGGRRASSFHSSHEAAESVKLLWCWRCKAEVPMLDEEEFAEISCLHRDAIQATKKYREQRGVSLRDVPTAEYFRPMLNRYEQLTGRRDTNPKTILHHRLSLYGPPCKHCGKPLRTPKAKLCGSCMFPVAE